MVLYDHLEECSAAYSMWIPKEWVGDLAQRTEGARRQIVDRIIKARVLLGKKPENEGFIISTQIRVIADERRITKALA